MLVCRPRRARARHHQHPADGRQHQRAGLLPHPQKPSRPLTARLANGAFRSWHCRVNLAQSERSSALQSMRDGRARVCVATRCRRRGIDLPNLDLVIHADLPSNPGNAAPTLGPDRPRPGARVCACLIVPEAPAAGRRCGSLQCQSDGDDSPLGTRHRRDRGALSRANHGDSAFRPPSRRRQRRVLSPNCCRQVFARATGCGLLPPADRPASRSRGHREPAAVQGGTDHHPPATTALTPAGLKAARRAGPDMTDGVWFNAVGRAQAARRSQVAVADDLQGRRRDQARCRLDQDRRYRDAFRDRRCQGPTPSPPR